jgi:hypothetical protein
MSSMRVLFHDHVHTGKTGIDVNGLCIHCRTPVGIYCSSSRDAWNIPRQTSKLVDEARRLQGPLEFKGLRYPYSNDLTRLKGAPAP